MLGRARKGGPSASFLRGGGKRLCYRTGVPDGCDFLKPRPEVGGKPFLVTRDDAPDGRAIGMLCQRVEEEAARIGNLRQPIPQADERVEHMLDSVFRTSPKPVAIGGISVLQCAITIASRLGKYL